MQAAPFHWYSGFKFHRSSLRKAKDGGVKSQSEIFKIAGNNEACGIKDWKKTKRKEWEKDEGRRKKGRKKKRERVRGAVVEAVTEGALINKSQLDTPSWFDTPFSILIISEDVCCALSTRPGLCAGQNQLLAAWCGSTCCAGTRSAVSPRGSWGCAIKTQHGNDETQLWQKPDTYTHTQVCGTTYLFYLFVLFQDLLLDFLWSSK